MPASDSEQPHANKAATCVETLEARIQKITQEVLELKSTSSVSKPATPHNTSVNVAMLEASIQKLTTDLAELKNTSSVDKPATADEDLPPPSPPLPASGQQHPPPPTPVLLNPVVPPPPPKATTTAAPQLIKLRGRKDIQQTIFNPLRAAITGTFPDWQLPTFLTTEDGAQIAFDQLQNRFEIDWRTCSQYKSAVLENLQVLSWTVEFFEDEPGSTPQEWPDRPRLDAVLQLSDGTWARWHTSGHIILSTQAMPTDAMQIRMNRYTALVKLREKREGQR